MFANLVVELKKHHYSQRGLAAYIGISESSMNDKMNGRTQFTLREMRKPFRRYSKAVHWTTCLKKKNEHLCCSTDAQREKD